jgi:hypothetical protein
MACHRRKCKPGVTSQPACDMRNIRRRGGDGSFHHAGIGASTEGLEAHGQFYAPGAGQLRPELIPPPPPPTHTARGCPTGFLLRTLSEDSTSRCIALNATVNEKR